VEFDFFSNPVKTQFAVQINDISDYQQGLSMDLIDASGKIILTKTLKSQKNNVYLRQVEKGLYIINLQYEGMIIASCKLIID
jgi:hypothetical protein